MHSFLCIPGDRPAAVAEELDQQISRYRSLTFADTTKRSYTTHLTAYLKFCSSLGQEAEPTDPLLTMRFIAHLAQRLKFTSLSQYINIISLINAELGTQDPTKTWPVRSLLKGIKRDKGNAVLQKLPITPQILLQMRELLKMDKPADAVLWAALTMAFFTLLRKSNLVPYSPKTFDPQRHPCRGDLSITSGGLTLQVKSSKTIQYGERHLLLPLPLLQGHPLCPVTAILAVLTLQPDLPPSAPLLAYPSPNGLHLLTQPNLINRLNKLLAALGLQPHMYGTHSFRRGGATWAFQAGLPGELIQTLGDWKSDCYKKYLTFDIDTKFNVMNIFTKDLPKTI